jgi:hypothetical protein
MRLVSNVALILSTVVLIAACSPSDPGTPSKTTTAPATAKVDAPTPPKPAATASVPASAAAAKIDPTKLDDKGYIRQWLLLGPIGFGEKYNAEDIDKETIPDEAKLTPKAGDKIKVASEEGEPGAFKTVQKELAWKPVVTEEDFFDFNASFALDNSDSCGGYAVAYLDAPDEIKGVTFSFSSNDNGLIYLNGKKIWSLVVARALEEDSDTVKDLTLNKGTNVVIFKVWNDTNNWQGCLRLLNKDDKPITNVKVKLAK